MSFNIDDLYSVSGGVIAWGVWNPSVTKYGTSSFYNWEQDNLPLYDLEERTHYLWERLGYMPSSIPGMAIVVSGSIPTHLELSSNVVTSLEDALKLIPEIVRFPILIEVCLSGSLGDIRLDNIKCSENGVLEIINRGFAKCNLADTSAITIGGNDWLRNLQSDSGASMAINSSAISLSANCSGVWDGSSWRGFVAHPHIEANNSKRAQEVVLNLIESSTYSLTNSDLLGDLINNNEFAFDPYPQASDPTLLFISTATDNTASAFDIVTSSLLDDSILKRGDAVANDRFTGFLTANHADRISIQNCDGPIYLRGFIADGASGFASPVGTYTTSASLSVKDSNGITLEHCGVMRGARVGAEIVNSQVVLRRGFASNRNYEVTNNTIGSEARADAVSYGLKIVNSDVELLADSYASGHDFNFWSQNNTFGIHLENSKLHGGESKADVNEETVISLGYNSVGLKAINSYVSLNGRLDTYNNTVGISLRNSTLELDELTVENNQNAGIDSIGSIILYNKKLNSRNDQSIGSESPNNLSQFHFYANGQHIVAIQSTIKPFEGLDMPSKFGRMRMQNSHGVETSGYAVGDRTSLPAVELIATIADLVHPRIQTNETILATTNPILGSCLKATNGSEVKLRGSVNRATLIIGPNPFQKQKFNAGVYVGKDSTVSFSGPTGIYRFGIDVLAENNSKIVFEPHMKNNAVDASGWDLINVGNHTSVELHSTRACLVVNKESILELKDLGDYHDKWSRDDLGESVSSSDYPTGLDGIAFNTSSNFFTGSLQFYPNPQDATLANRLNDTTNIDATLAENYTPGASNHDKFVTDGSNNYNYFLHNFFAGGLEDLLRSEVSRGGFCVRALGGSRVDVLNVHFPTGWTNPDASFFGPGESDAGCNDLRIWNIGDNSQLNAAYCSVSGVYPSQTGYSGPRSTYFSGTGPVVGDTSNVVYTYPAHTPNTGTIAVLDYFGSGVEVSAGNMDTLLSAISNSNWGDTEHLGASGYENRGPFRIYFNVNPIAKTMGYLSGTIWRQDDTRPYQHFAQGYGTSGDTSSLESFSALDYALLQDQDGLVAATSGVYLPSSMMDYGHEKRVMLDESAANTFANAKNGTIPWSARGRLCTVYRATIAQYGEGFATTTSGLGIGFKSSNVFDIRRDN